MDWTPVRTAASPPALALLAAIVAATGCDAGPAASAARTSPPGAGTPVAPAGPGGTPGDGRLSVASPVSVGVGMATPASVPAVPEGMRAVEGAAWDVQPIACIDVPSAADVSGLGLFQVSGGGWREITAWREPARRSVCGPLQSLGTLGVFETTAPGLPDACAAAGGTALLFGPGPGGAVTVPTGSLVTVQAAGGGGSGSWSALAATAGGRGGYAEATFAMPDGGSLVVEVGEGGGASVPGGTGTGGPGAACDRGCGGAGGGSSRVGEAGRWLVEAGGGAGAPGAEGPAAPALDGGGHRLCAAPGGQRGSPAQGPSGGGGGGWCGGEPGEGGSSFVDPAARRVLEAAGGGAPGGTGAGPGMPGAVVVCWADGVRRLAGTVAGLAGTGLVLAATGQPALDVPAGATSFAFPRPLPVGTSFAVTVARQPTSPAQTCAVAGGSGVAGQGSAAVAVTCRADVQVAVSPASATVAPGASQVFAASVSGTADGSVTWSVLEGDAGGRIAPDGRYVAPAAPGSYHVLATSRADPSASGRASIFVPPPVPASVSLGVNSFYMSDYEPQHFFADLMRQARPWNVIGDTGTRAPRDADGWPTGDAEVILLIGLGGRPQPGAAGVYRMSFRGRASVTFTGGPPGSVAILDQAWDPATGITTADLDVSAQNTALILAFRGQPGGIKDLRVLRPGHGPSEIFSRVLLERIRPFSTMRFMDWLGPPSGGMNANGESAWSDRTRPGYAVQARAPDHGAAWEWIVLLANAARKDVWINVPYLADDEYVTKLARLFRYGSDGVEPYAAPQANPVYPPLDPGLKLYVEHGNELWNGIFRYARQNEADAAAEVAAGDPHHLAWDGSTNAYYHAFRRVGWLAVRDSNLFRAVFGDAEMGTRVLPVLAAQIGFTDTARQALRYVDEVHGPSNPFGNPGHPVSWYVHSISGAPYIETVGAREGMTVDEVMAGMRVHLETRLYPQIDAWTALARAYGVQATAYEGGQGLIPDVSFDAMLAAQSDPRMKDLTVDLLHYWYGRGGGLFMYYALCSGYTQYGFWGLSDDLTSEATPKWEAVRQVLSGR